MSAVEPAFESPSRLRTRVGTVHPLVEIDEGLGAVQTVRPEADHPDIERDVVAHARGSAGDVIQLWLTPVEN